MTYRAPRLIRKILDQKGYLNTPRKSPGALPRGVPLNHASFARPDGNLWCSQKHQCKEFNRRFKAEVKAYAVQVQQWLATGEHAPTFRRYLRESSRSKTLSARNVTVAA